MFSEEELERYDRQIKLEGFGIEAQNRLKTSSVLIIGVGGLGCVSLQYLVAAGIGRIGIIDNDKVSLSNLQRQVIYRENEIGMQKVEQAKRNLNSLNSNVDIKTYQCFLEKGNAKSIIGDYDIIIDATDNFTTRYLINDVCVGLHKPFIYGSIGGYSGQIAVFNIDETSSCYRDLYPNEKELQGRKIENNGVIGVLPSIVASLQASEAIKIITNTGEILKDKLLVFDILSNHFNLLKIIPNPSLREESLMNFHLL